MDTKHYTEILQEYDIVEREQFLMGLFMENGPKFLCKYLGLESTKSKEWQIVFDYFVLEKNVMFALVKRYYHHFQEMYANFGPQKVRDILGIKLRKYDAVWLPVHDLIGVGEECLQKYVHNNRFSLSKQLQVYGGERIREDLGILPRKYDGVWEQILDILRHHTVQQYMTTVDSERLLSVFTAQMNLRRDHVALL